MLEHTKGQPLMEPYASAADKLKTASLGDQDNCRLMSLIPGNGVGAGAGGADTGTKMNVVTVTGSFNLGTLQSV